MASRLLRSFLLLTLVYPVIGLTESHSGSAVLKQDGVLSVEVIHEGQPITLQRNLGRNYRIETLYSTTGRGQIQSIHRFARQGPRP
jgi:hypothetical protein